MATLSTLTKANARSMIQQMFDDPSAARWTGPNLDVLTQLVIDELWSEILDMASYFNSQYDQVNIPLRPPGFISLETVANGGDLTQRLYRIQQVIADGRQYFPKDPRDFLMSASAFGSGVANIQASTGVEQRFSYQFLGDQMWLHPLGNVTTFVELRYSFRPKLYTTLADTDVVTFPDGCEGAYIYRTAALAMMKGSAEQPNELMGIADNAHTAMINTIRRMYHGMTVPFAPSNQWEWGGI